MAGDYTNSAYNLTPTECSSHSCSEFYFRNPIGRPGTQEGTTFRAPRAAFSSDMVGGRIEIASKKDDGSDSEWPIILEVVDSKTLTVNISQNVSATEYIIKYGGVQYNQNGDMSVQSLLIDGSPALSVIASEVLGPGSGSYVVPANARYLSVELAGGGGGGGPADRSVATTSSVGLGGGAGGYARSFFVPTSESYSYEVGTGGTGGLADGTAGTDGGSTTFYNIIANGGAGAGHLNIEESSTVVLAEMGGAGGDATGGNLINSYGQPGHLAGGISITGSSLISIYSGAGGNSFFGGGGAGFAYSSTDSSGSSNAGRNGTAPGAGGSGGIAFKADSSSYVSGGHGGDGIIIVTAYS